MKHHILTSLPTRPRPTRPSGFATRPSEFAIRCFTRPSGFATRPSGFAPCSGGFAIRRHPSRPSGFVIRCFTRSGGFAIRRHPSRPSGFAIRCFLLLLASLVYASCTTVDLCDISAAEHPHRSTTYIRYHWPTPDAVIPDEMNVVASRPLNTWRTYGIAETHIDPSVKNKITRMFSMDDPDRPGYDESTGPLPHTRGDGEAPETPDTSDTPEEPEPEPDPTRFYLRAGDYNIFVINEQKINPETTNPDNIPDQPVEDQPAEGTEGTGGAADSGNAGTGTAGNENADSGSADNGNADSGNADSGSAGNGSADSSTAGNGTAGSGSAAPVPVPEEIPLRSALVIEGLEDYIFERPRMVDSLFLCVRNMGGTKPSIVMDNDLPDFNPNYEYLEDITAPIYYGILRDFHVEDDPHKETVIDMDMTCISQAVRLRFNIRADAGIILPKKPIVELSGICGRFNIYEAYLDTTKLYRMARHSEPLGTPIAATEQDTVYTCETNFYTLGIVPSNNKSYLNGSGVIQVAIRATAILKDEQGNILYKEDGVTPRTRTRYVYGGINPYDEFRAARIMEIRDGKTYMRYDKNVIEIDIEKELHIKYEQIAVDDDSMNWKPGDETDPDGDIKVEM